MQPFIGNLKTITLCCGTVEKKSYMLLGFWSHFYLFLSSQGLVLSCIWTIKCRYFHFKMEMLFSYFPIFLNYVFFYWKLIKKLFDMEINRLLFFILRVNNFKIFICVSLSKVYKCTSITYIWLFYIILSSYIIKKSNTSVAGD
jgi:hypothetical protein